MNPRRLLPEITDFDRLRRFASVESGFGAPKEELRELFLWDCVRFGCVDEKAPRASGSGAVWQVGFPLHAAILQAG